MTVSELLSVMAQLGVIQLEMMPKAPDKRAENNPWPEWPRVCKTDYGQEEAIAMFGTRSSYLPDNRKRIHQRQER